MKNPNIASGCPKALNFGHFIAHFVAHFIEFGSLLDKVGDKVRDKVPESQSLGQTPANPVNHRAGLALAICTAAVMCAATVRAAVFYVKPTGNDAASGASWALAKQGVTNAMAAATAGDQIWVAAGIYTQLVTMKTDVALYGGFNGTETTLAQRNWLANTAVLYGNSQGAVVTITNGGPNTRLDGFYITGGGSPNTTFGGGISSVAASPTIANNYIFGNRANGGAGGGIFLSGSQAAPPTTAVITNNTVYQNACLGVTGSDGSSYGDGGGIAIGNASPIIVANRILGNLAARHGGGLGLWMNSRALVANNIIEGNASSLGFSGGLGGGILASADDFNDRPSGGICAPTIVNNIIAANGAAYGGGAALVDSPFGGATLMNNTIVANTGSGVFWGGTPTTNYNNLLAFNSTGYETLSNNPVTLRNNDVYGNSVLSSNTDYVGLPNATGANGNISADPLLANFPVGEFELEPNSPCINAGLTSVVLGIPDFNGNPRVQGGAVDIGAFESSGATISFPTRVLHVSLAGNDANDGLTWAAAKRTVSAAISALGPLIGGEVWVAQGTYSNHLSIPPFVYLYGGFAGTETSRSSRNLAAHPTVLDGGGQPTVILSQSAGYLVSAVDGFTIQNGGVYTAGNGVGGPDARGGAINCNVSAPIIANNIIQSNSVGTILGSTGNSQGGGIFMYISHAKITGNTFRNNDVLDGSAGSGGAIYCRYSSPCITQNSFTYNRSVYGPAIHAYVCSILISGNTFVTNNYYYVNGDFHFAGATDGAVFLEGCNNFVVNGNIFQGNWATYGAGLDLKAVWVGQVENNTFFGNLALNAFSGTGFGGAIFCSIAGQDIPGNVVIMHNTIVSNTAPGLFPGPMDQGGGICLSLATNTMVLANNIIAFNSGGIFQSGSINPIVYGNNCVTNAINYIGIAPGAGDIHGDPQFVNRASNFHLLAASPCIDAGLASYALPLDKDSVPRPLDGNNDGVPANDLGAFEFIHPSADSDHDGMSDAAEILAGTDPTNSASVLKLQASGPAPANSIILKWPSVIGRAYHIQYRSPLSGGNWQTLTNNLQGTGNWLQVNDPIANGGLRFYRLGVAKN